MTQLETQLLKRNSPIKYPWYSGIYLRMHLGLRLLLWHSGEAKRTPYCDPYDQLW